MKMLTWLLPLLSVILIVGSLDADISTTQFILQECLGIALGCGGYLASESAEVSR